MNHISPSVTPGTTTLHLDALADLYTTSLSLISAPLNYGGIGLTESSSTSQLCLQAHNLVHLLITLLHFPGWKWFGAGFGNNWYAGIPICGFPKSVCTSVNEVVCHGIPSGAEVLSRGDLLNVDVTVITGEGWHGDTSKMWLVGQGGNFLEEVDLDEEGWDGGLTEVESSRVRLAVVAREAMYLGISACKPGGTVGDIGR
ncbi:hypothetical protein TrRE_jg11428, partial [Triparma retinervis]